MAFQHPLDPPVQWGAAERCGKLVAQGVLDAADVVPKLFEAAMRAGYEGEPSGLRARLAWNVADVADAWRSRRDRMEFRIRRAIAPLLSRRAPAMEIVRTAHALNERDDEPLLRREVQSIVAEEMAAFLRHRARRPRRVG